MGSQFNPQILVEKLSKLNSSQQSIETLSHWCIFHMNKAKQVVETWDRQFHCAPREQRLAFLYLANDILQNSRRKGAEFVAEFWKVLPGSLRDVIENGDDYGRNSAMRLISIWEERKVFGSRGQILKEEFGKRQLDNGNKNRKPVALKPQSPDGNALDKLVSGYEAICRSQTDEDAILTKCRNAISFVEKIDKNIQVDFRSGHADSTIGNELKEQNVILKDCIEQLAAVESARSNLVSLLREALQEQVYKLDQVRDQLQAAQSRTELVANICSQFVGSSDNGRILAESSEGNPVSQMPQKFVPGSGEQPNAVTYTRQIPFSENSGHVEDNTKSAAAAMAAKLAASSSSAQMLTFVLSTLASEGVIGNQNQDPSSSEYPPSEKRAKIENEQPYIPQNSQAPPPTTSPSEPPPPPSSPPPLPPMPPPIQSYPVPQYMQTAMPILGGPYCYNTSQPPPPLQPPGYTPAGPPVAGVSAFAPSSNAYQSYPPEGGFYGQPSSLPMAPMNRQ